MVKIENFTYAKSKSFTDVQSSWTVTKSFGLTVHLDQYTEESLREAIARAEMLIDEVLNQPEKQNIPNIDLAEIDALPWRNFAKGAEPGSAKKGYVPTTGPNSGSGAVPLADDRPGWCFRDEGIPEGSAQAKAISKTISKELAQAIEQAGGKLEIGEWTFTLKGDSKNLINRSKREKKQ